VNWFVVFFLFNFLLLNRCFIELVAHVVGGGNGES
jgi:hypothetical protein